MGPPTTIREALDKFEDVSGTKASESEEVKLSAQVPPIAKLDATISTLNSCKKLSLSTNCIDRIANLHGLKNLRILSLTRNNIRSLAGLDPVGETLEELWISYNQIESLRGITMLKNLKVLYMSNNNVKEWKEVEKLSEVKTLENLLFVGNPIYNKLFEQGDWEDLVKAKLTTLRKLDGVPIIRAEDTE